MNNLIVLFVIIPLIGAFCCLLGKFWRCFPLAQIASITAVVCSLILLGLFYPSVLEYGQMTYTIGGWNETVGIQQYFDGLSWMSFAIVLLIALLALLFAIAEGKYEYMFYFFYLVMLAGIAGVLLAADIFNLFVCFEILGITVYIMIAYFQKDHALLASLKYLLLSSLGMAFFLIGIFIIYQQTGSLSMFGAGAVVTTNKSSSIQMIFAVVALIAGIGVRTAFLPFHTWLPEAHAYAPHPVSAMLSGIIIKISFLTIWRLVYAFNTSTLQHLFIWIGAGTALIAVIWALAQTDCKKLLAWHSISQMGYILTAFGVGQPLSLTASFSHVLYHGLFKSLLFLCIGSVIHVTGERNIKRLGNLAGKMPVLMVIFLVAAFSIAGVPPFNGFVSKKLIVSSLKQYPVVYYVLWATGIGTVASFIKLSAIFRRRVGQSAFAVRDLDQLPSLAYVPLIVIAILCGLTGVFGNFLTRRIFFLLFAQQWTFSVSFYSLANLLNTGISVCAGLTLYLLIVSQPGRKIMDTLCNLRLSFNTALLFFVLGFVGLTVFTLLLEAH
jgi:formate hydrogenlyase subunit 3/multisubunit Na+/H+ antiporter MnhD subunit